jgi:membrane protein DedA with SNARE-associated domain
MTDVFEVIADYSYLGIFFLLLGINAAPLLMPPSWIVLSSFLALDPTLNILVLALVGATGATIGRFILKRISHFFSTIYRQRTEIKS